LNEAPDEILDHFNI
jgi:hypothetical protein